MQVDHYIRSEVERQHSTQFAEFLDAYNYARHVRLKLSETFLMGKFAQGIAQRVDPGVNAWTLRGDRYANLRVSHVGFMHGGKAAPAGEVKHQFERLTNSAHLVETEEDIEIFIRSLLEIHPWADGNGRTASILRNWMLGTLDDPSPLPYYFENA